MFTYIYFIYLSHLFDATSYGEIKIVNVNFNPPGPTIRNLFRLCRATNATYL